MVSIKKAAIRSKLKSTNYLPLSSSPYQMSVSFAHKFLNRYNFEIYQQAWHIVRELVNDKVNSTAAAAEHGAGAAAPVSGNGFHVAINDQGGYAAAIVSLMARDRLHFQTEVPNQVIRSIP